MRGQKALYEWLKKLHIDFEYHEHPPVPTIEEALKNWRHISSTHCKNLFFRNHKGNRHYLVILEHTRQLNIKDLEQRLKQGKITFASEKRLNKYLGVSPGSVSPFGLMNDMENHVHVFIDKALQQAEKLSFHPNENTASLVIQKADFEKFLIASGNSYEYIQLYD